MTSHDNGTSVVYHLERDILRLDKDVERIDRDVVVVQVALAKLGTKVSMFAALGAVIGGGLVSLLVRFLIP